MISVDRISSSKWGYILILVFVCYYVDLTRWVSKKFSPPCVYAGVGTFSVPMNLCDSISEITIHISS